MKETENLFEKEDLRSFGAIAQVMVFTPDDAPSQQAPDDFEQDYEERKAIAPPHNLEACITAVTISTRLNKLIQIRARNTVGLGYMLEPVDPEDPGGNNPATRAERERLEEFFAFCNPEMSFIELYERMRVAAHTTGNGYLELVRDKKGRPSRLYYVAPTTMRVMGSGEGYVQLRRSPQTGKLHRAYFKRLGDLRIMDKRTGEFEDTTPPDFRATEIIHRKIHSPVSDYYGVPLWLPASQAIALNRRIGTWNLNFVVNDASWPVAVIVENAELGTESMKNLETMVNRTGKGVRGAGKVMLLQAQRKNPNARGPDARIKVQPLSLGVQDDGSFLDLRKKNEEEVREAFGISSVHLGSADDLNRASAAVSRVVTNEQEFIPELVAEEFAVNMSLMRELKAERNVFRFRRPKTTDDLQIAQMLYRLGVDAVVTVSEMRRYLNKVAPMLDLPEIKEEWADVTPARLEQEARAGTRPPSDLKAAKQALQDMLDRLQEYETDKDIG